MTRPGDSREREQELTQSRRGRIPADTLANRLMLARKMAGLSIRDAADLCQLGRGAWTKWETGSRPLDLLEITGVIAEKLDVDLEWLRFGGALTPSRGRPTKRSGLDTDEYLTRSERPMRVPSVRPDDTRPKVRADSRGSNLAPTIGRRAVPVR